MIDYFAGRISGVLQTPTWLYPVVILYASLPVAFLLGIVVPAMSVPNSSQFWILLADCEGV